jgi:tetratricopeptide (TPR) repeat protein
MNKITPHSWHQIGEVSLLSLVFLLPLALSFQTYDLTALKTTVLELGGLALIGAWILQGLLRGRWDFAAVSKPVLLPAFIYAVWAILSFLFAPHKMEALSHLLPPLSMVLIYIVVLANFSGARTAARVSGAFITAGFLICAHAIAQRLGWVRGPVIFSTLGSPDQCAFFIALALPAALAFWLDEEIPTLARYGALLFVPLSALAAIATQSVIGIIAYILSGLFFIAAGAWVTRKNILREGLWVLIGALFMAAVSLALSALLPHPNLISFEIGTIGLQLWRWLFLATIWTAITGARALWKAGRQTESHYTLGFFAATAVGFLAQSLTKAGSANASIALFWIVAALSAGLPALAAGRGRVSAYPLPMSEDVRRMMHAPLLLLLLALSLPPTAWLRSAVDHNAAIALARKGQFELAAGRFSSVWRGSSVYPDALYRQADAWLKSGKPEQALIAYEQLGRFAPDYALRHARLGEVYALLGRWPEAAREHARQADLTPAFIGNLIAWSQAARASGDLAQARLAAEKAGLLNPQDPAVRTALAANDLMARKIAQQNLARRKNERQAIARKPKSR